MKTMYQKYKKYWPAAFFVGGFLFDLATTDRIDQSFSLIQQFVYLLLLMILFFQEVKPAAFWLKEKSVGAKLWRYHTETVHFLFGSLLSLYTIFYFKSGTLTSSFLFMIFLSALLVINEFPFFQAKGVGVRAALLALCLSSYFIYLVPVLTGSIGWLAFIFAMVLSSALFLWLNVRLERSGVEKKWLKHHVFLPGLLVQVVFVLLYFFKVLPPVPISLKHIGIYHHIEKKEGDFYLSYYRPWYKFWQSGAQTFLRREGDRIYCFVSVFSPTLFEERLNLLWYQKTRSGWTLMDQVPLPIQGGRDQGFRSAVYKSNFDNGQWQVRVATSDGREVGRIRFDVIRDDSQTQREMKVDIY